jgi:large subunit ribosomal protein L6e
LKQLPSGLLLVTGPFKVNGVPLRRVNQAYVIATSTKVDISSVKVPESVNDAFFTAKEEKHSKSAEGFATQDAKKKNELPADKKTAQKSVDDAVTAAVSKVPQLKEYLGAQFSLSKGVYPHELKF